MHRAIPLAFALLFTGCGTEDENNFRAADAAPGSALESHKAEPTPATSPNPLRNAYFGDLHVHTGYSFDAFTFGTTALPDDAYRYARGEAIEHPWGYQVQLREPLDFYAVTDHALFLGLAREAANPDTEIAQQPFARKLHDLNAEKNRDLRSLGFRSTTFGNFVGKFRAALAEGRLSPESVAAVSRSAWRDIARSADAYYQPGTLTTFAGFEYTSGGGGGSLHRNVIFSGTDALPALPFSRDDSQNPEGLWDWMDALRANGVESLAIPHNSNTSNGQMFALVDWASNPLDNEYSQQRLRNEPLAEITQVKGTSDTHPELSPQDEWANFEIAPFRASSRVASAVPGSYLRDAYLRGMQVAASGTVNPYQFGLIGSSDTHVGATTDREDGFFSKSGLMDGRPFLRGSVPLSLLERTAASVIVPSMVVDVAGRRYFDSANFETWGASGLAGVWAEDNSRESIYSALRRKETFATTGPRMRLRVFAGHDYTQQMLRSEQLVQQAYAGGVPMGGELVARGSNTPALLLWALRDARSASLQRIQVIKGFVDDGRSVERIYDAACAGDAEVDPATHRCPDNGATVNLEDCTVNDAAGADELLTLWRDPEFDPAVDAFYYVRVLENPTCRWSTWDAIRAGAEPRADLPATIQERAWSSPIWYRAKD
ncbi:MAG: DUF3604 domain-containing protein [Halioglobus sp.]|nr:DUF3604 domain-containing protein [Halioglobus sp.]